MGVLFLGEALVLCYDSGMSEQSHSEMRAAPAAVEHSPGASVPVGPVVADPPAAPVAPVVSDAPDGAVPPVTPESIPLESRDAWDFSSSPPRRRTRDELQRAALEAAIRLGGYNPGNWPPNPDYEPDPAKRVAMAAEVRAMSKGPSFNSTDYIRKCRDLDWGNAPGSEEL